MQIKTAGAQNPNLMGSLMLCAEFLKIIHILLSLLKVSGECSDVKLNLSCGIFKTKLL